MYEILTAYVPAGIAHQDRPPYIKRDLFYVKRDLLTRVYLRRRYAQRWRENEREEGRKMRACCHVFQLTHTHTHMSKQVYVCQQVSFRTRGRKGGEREGGREEMVREQEGGMEEGLLPRVKAGISFGIRQVSFGIRQVSFDV
jgi:hypothetical protein